MPISLHQLLDQDIKRTNQPYLYQTKHNAGILPVNS